MDDNNNSTKQVNNSNLGQIKTLSDAMNYIGQYIGDEIKVSYTVDSHIKNRKNDNTLFYIHGTVDGRDFFVVNFSDDVNTYIVMCKYNGNYVFLTDSIFDDGKHIPRFSLVTDSFAKKIKSIIYHGAVTEHNFETCLLLTLCESYVKNNEVFFFDNYKYSFPISSHLVELGGILTNVIIY